MNVSVKKGIALMVVMIASMLIGLVGCSKKEGATSGSSYSVDYKILPKMARVPNDMGDISSGDMSRVGGGVFGPASLIVTVKGPAAKLAVILTNPEGKSHATVIQRDQMIVNSKTVLCDMGYSQEDDPKAGVYTLRVKTVDPEKVVWEKELPFAADQLKSSNASHGSDGTPVRTGSARTPQDLVAEVHRLVLRDDFNGLAALMPPAYRPIFRKLTEVRPHMVRVADLMDAKIGQNTGAGLRRMASARKMDPLGGTLETNDSVDWSKVEIKEIDSSHMQVSFKNDYGHFVRSCFLTVQSGTWYWLPTETPDETPEQMKMKAASEGIMAEMNTKLDAALTDIEKGLNDGTITNVNFQQKMSECMTRHGVQ